MGPFKVSNLEFVLVPLLQRSREASTEAERYRNYVKKNRAGRIPDTSFESFFQTHA